MNARPASDHLPARRAGVLLPLLLVPLVGAGIAVGLGHTSTSTGVTRGAPAPAVSGGTGMPSPTSPIDTSRAAVVPIDTVAPGTAPLRAPTTTTTTTEPPPSTTAIETTPPAVAPRCVSVDIVGEQFEPDSAVVSDRGIEQLRAELSALLASSAPIHVDGHTDDRPTNYPGHNDGLSEDRARGVADALESLGVDHDRLRPEGHADREPLDTSGTPDGDARNRRVEVRMNCD